MAAVGRGAEGLTRDADGGGYRRGDKKREPTPAAELWANRKYFLEQVLPGCAEARVALALHPDDPPLPSFRGVEQIMCSAAALVRACLALLLRRHARRHADEQRRYERSALGGRHTRQAHLAVHERKVCSEQRSGRCHERGRQRRQPQPARRVALKAFVAVCACGPRPGPRRLASPADGAGSPACPGAAMKQRLVAMAPEQSARRHKGPNAEGYTGRSANWKPIIAAVHGYALGAGIVIAVESDMIVASEDVKFGITETRRGLPAARIWAKVNAFMPSKILSEMAITGEPIEASELYRLGLINRLVPTGEHLTVAEELAEKVLKSPPLATRSAVKLMRRQWVQPSADADMQMLPLKLHETEDFKEASLSFVEKRPPKYHAR